jgi:hypothetical protein
LVGCMGKARNVYRILVAKLLRNLLEDGGKYG